MSERLTSVRLNGAGRGFADYGRLPIPDMIARLRDIAARQKADAEKILAARDEDFTVVTYVGPYAQREYEVLQEGTSCRGERVPA